VLLSGGGVRIQGHDSIGVSAGDFWRTPPNVRHAFRAGSEGATVLDVFSPPRDEYRIKGSGVGTQAKSK
ncbi:MAG: hypothetical protein P8N03_06135, partial [Arenicellales bacterium]|nr:hypothetical protein [Arenicellales bacterium]